VNDETEKDPARILVTADLHYGVYLTGDALVEELARFVCASEADAFAICGDVADPRLERFAACLALFAGFEGLKLLVPGNHDVWNNEMGSRQKYREALPAIAADHGFAMLDAGPVTAGRVGFIGSMAWYDYSFRNRELNVEMEHYRKKELPGVCIWNDGRFIDWQVSDEEFTRKCLRKLRAAYRAVEPRVHTVVALLHHLPFAELLYGRAGAAQEFSRAFLGSELFGRLLLDCPKVRYVFCGHRHGAASWQVDHLESFCVGSEYLLKRLIALDLATGEREFYVFRPDSEAGGAARGPLPDAQAGGHAGPD